MLNKIMLTNVKTINKPKFFHKVVKYNESGIKFQKKYIGILPTLLPLMNKITLINNKKTSSDDKIYRLFLNNEDDIYKHNYKKDEIEKKYRELQRIYHPDNPHTGNEYISIKLNRIKNILKDPMERARYILKERKKVNIEDEVKPNKEFYLSIMNLFENKDYKTIEKKYNENLKNIYDEIKNNPNNAYQWYKKAQYYQKMLNSL